MKKIAILSPLHITFPMTFFSLLHKKHVIYHTQFPTYLLSNHFVHTIYFFTILPTKFINFFLLVSPLQMVSWGAARPLRPRLSTPLGSDYRIRHFASLATFVRHTCIYLIVR